MGDSPTSRIAITLCTKDTTDNGKSFVNEVSPYLRISTLNFKRACPDNEQLAEKNHLIATIHQFDGQMNLEVKGHINGQYYEGYRRHIPWVTNTSAPLESTLESNKQVSFALLLETLLFDFEYIRLNFVPERSDVSVADFEDGEIGAPAHIPETVETAQSIDEKAEAIPEPSTGNEASLIEKSDNEASADSSDGEDNDSSDLEKRDSRNDDRPTVGTSTLGLQGGMAYSPQDTVFIEIDLSYLLKVGRVRLFANIGQSPWSTFKIGERPFRTFLFNVGIGGGLALVERAHLAVLLTAFLRLRTNLIRREKIPGATFKTWLDVGAGTALWIHLLPRRLLGVLFSVGIDVFPTAREVVIPNGPRKRFGLVSIPAKIGGSLTF